MFFENFTFPFDALYPILPFLSFLSFPLRRRSGRAGGPYFLPLQKVGKDRRKGVSTPLRIPGPKWGAGRPPLETPKSRCAIRDWPNSSPLRGWSFGAVGESASACALAPRLPHLHRFGVGGFAPLPAARFAKWGTFCRSCAPAHWDNVRNGFCGEAFANLSGSSCREAARSSVTSLARLWPKAHSSATASGGIPKGAQPSLASLCLLSAGQKVGAGAA